MQYRTCTKFLSTTTVVIERRSGDIFADELFLKILSWLEQTPSCAMADINFHRIAPRLGSHSGAFEELCCQLARRTVETDQIFERFRGAGGDGGVEWIVRRSDGSVIGWQAKFVFDVDSLIAQTSESFETALSIHEKLTKYVVCFPFDPTGRTARKAKSGRPATSEIEKLELWAS